jgi:predicted TPR repeat methyltransferase
MVDHWWDYAKVKVWQKSLWIEGFERSGGGLLRQRIEALEAGAPSQDKRPSMAYENRDGKYYQSLHDTNLQFQQNNWLVSELETLRRFTTGHVIELGCGNGKFLDAAAGAFDSLVGMDWAIAPNIKSVVEKHENVSFIQADLIDGFPDAGYADLLVSADFLEHLPRECLSRVLARTHTKARFHFHKIACYDDGHSHLSILDPVEWLRIFKEISPAYFIYSLEERAGDKTRLVCCIAN